MKILLKLSFAMIMFGLASPLISADQEVLKFEGKSGAKTIVLVAGDEEYRSEESMPMLAKILSKHHGFNCIVLFSWDNSGQYIDPNGQANVKGWHYLNDADLMIIGTRFRTPSKVDCDIIASYLKAGNPVIGFRTATHGFKGKDLIAEGLTLHAFGPQIIGDGWVSHHGRHKKQGARGVIEKANAAHSILNSVTDVFAPSDVYGIKALTTKDTILLRGAVTQSLAPNSEMIPGPKNNPMQPLAWLHPYQIKGGKQGMTFATTMGSSVDFVNEDLRRMLINASYFLLGLEVPKKANVDYIDPFYPSFYSANGKVWAKRKLQISEFALGEAPHYPDLPGSPKWDYRPVPPNEVAKVIPKVNAKPLKSGAQHLFSDQAEEGQETKWSKENGALVSQAGSSVSEQHDFKNIELEFDYAVPLKSEQGASLVFDDQYKIKLPPLNTSGKWHALKIELSQVKNKPVLASLWLDGKELSHKVVLSGASSTKGNFPMTFSPELSQKVDLSGTQPFTILSRFKTTKDGAIFSKCNAKGKWVPGAKTLYLKKGALVFDIGWLGALRVNGNFSDGKWHTVVVAGYKGKVSLYVDGKKVGEKNNFQKPDGKQFVFKIGEAADNFGGAFAGEINHVKYYL